jgi:hypothetical protein
MLVYKDTSIHVIASRAFFARRGNFELHARRLPHSLALVRNDIAAGTACRRWIYSGYSRYSWTFFSPRNGQKRAERARKKDIRFFVFFRGFFVFFVVIF